MWQSHICHLLKRKTESSSCNTDKATRSAPSQIEEPPTLPLEDDAQVQLRAEIERLKVEVDVLSRDLAWVSPGNT